MREHPKLIGDRTTAMVLARLLEFYEVVLLPFGENQRYDLVIEDEDRFIRVQCKTGRLRNGSVVFPTCSSIMHWPNRDPGDPYGRPYKGQIELFGVYCPETGDVYLVPADEVGARQGALRVEAPRNGQTKHVRWADDHRLTEVSRERIRVLFGARGDLSRRLFESPARYHVACTPG